MKILIKNLDSSVTDTDLFQLFREFGHVSEIHITSTKEGKPLGYAFVLMKEYNDGIQAIKNLDNLWIKGTYLEIQEFII